MPSTTVQDTERSDLMSLQELAQRTQRNYVHLWELARRDELPVPVFRFGRRYFVSRRAYEALMAAQREPQAQSA